MFFLAARMEQIANSEVDFDASPQNAQIHVIFNRSGVFCNTTASDSVCLCYSNGSLMNGVTGNIKVHQIVSDTWQHTFSTKRSTLYKASVLKELVLVSGLSMSGAPWTPSEVLLWFNPGKQLSPTELLAHSPTVGWGENWKGKSEKTHGLR